MKKDFDDTLILDFLNSEFPKKRIKPIKSKRFKFGIIVSESYTKTNKIKLTIKNDIEQIVNVLYEITSSYFGTYEPYKIKETIFNYLL